jgi:NADH:ubiquinone oxidoreductase subunit F (NADH-binding)
VVEKKNSKRREVLKTLSGQGLSREAMARVAELTGVPEADVYGAATFYTLLTDPGPRVCQGLTCKLEGADELAAELESRGGTIHRVSCLGQCDRAPVSLGEDLRLDVAGPRGAITPDDPELPMNLAGAEDTQYRALARAREMGPEAVIEALELSGLQGRGGAGFPASIKWRAVLGEAATPKYVVCNADEGEPGTFKDREIMLRRPHLMLEALAIAAFVTGAESIYIYVRGEFPEETACLERALAAGGLEDFDFRFIEGHGAYICGEETALIESIEGRRGMPRLKPPYPTQHGLWGKPTLMNNVETLACVPDIVMRGGQRFRDMGRTEPGSKLYCLSGHVVKPGVYELPLGVSLNELVEAGGGYVGTPLGFSPGGASSGVLPISLADEPMDFKGLLEHGSMLGSAGVVVLNDTVDMAEMAQIQAVFFEDESCGQCAPCRIGARLVRQALDRYLDSGDPSALQHLDDLAWEMDEGSICGLGMVAAEPAVSALKHFPGHFGIRS